MRTSRRNLNEINLWPGFVDVLGTLLIVTIIICVSYINTTNKRQHQTTQELLRIIAK